jgi:ribosomal-protein-alanine N-acetyltransferase
MLPLETERLLIREYGPADLDDVARMFADPAMTLGGDEPLTREQSRAWIEEEIEHVRRDGTGRYAVVLSATGEVVGGCGLVRRELTGGVEIELGYHVRHDLWGRGLATEAALACVAEADARGVRRLIAFIEPGHGASEAVARHIGMHREDRVEWFGRPHDLWALELPAAADGAVLP